MGENNIGLTKLFINLIRFSFRLAYRSDLLMDFLRAIAKRTWNHARMCFLGL